MIAVWNRLDHSVPRDCAMAIHPYQQAMSFHLVLGMPWTFTFVDHRPLHTLYSLHERYAHTHARACARTHAHALGGCLMWEICTLRSTCARTDARHGTARHGTARHGTARHGTARHVWVRHAPVWELADSVLAIWDDGTDRTNKPGRCLITAY